MKSVFNSAAAEPASFEAGRVVACSASADPAALEGGRVVIVAVVGPSCSGKSTMSKDLSTALNGTDVKVICQDDFFLFEQFKTDNCPFKLVHGLPLKDWDTSDAIDFPGCGAAIRDAKAEAMERAKAENKTVYLVVEGFQLCAHEETRSLLDVIVELRLPKAQAWQRRLRRALSMRHLRAGLGDDMNYEVPDTYVFGEEGSEARALARDSMQAAAMASEICAQEGDEAWLRFYFEEVVWPEAERSLEDNQCGKPILSIDASSPAGKEEWLATRLPQAADFVHQILHPTPPAVA